jgi:hypothetical protein
MAQLNPIRWNDARRQVPQPYHHSAVERQQQVHGNLRPFPCEVDVDGDEGEDEGQYDEHRWHDLGEGWAVGETVVIDLLL